MSTLKRAKKSIRLQLNMLLGGLLLPLFVMTAVLLYMLSSFNQQYSAALHNATIAAQFSNDFKNDLDLAMWYHFINARPQEELEWAHVDKAGEILGRLEKSTLHSDNRWRIKSMQNILKNLSKYMVDIANTKSYDEREAKWENDIVLTTKLFEQYMHDYIFDEVKEMSRLQEQINSRVKTAIITTFFTSVLLIVAILLYSIRFTRRITQPIDALCQKVRLLGDGDFTIYPIHTKIEEIQVLDDGFNDMVGRMNALIERGLADQKILHRTELELLQAQINPHFLYNTLDSIIWLAEAHRYTDVIHMVTSLSVFFRNSLSKGKDIITLMAEKNQVESYLDIQRIRYSDILDYEIVMPEDLMGCLIPKLILQPLVENALYHGIKHKRGLGKITISGKSEDQDMILAVSDNGIGMPYEQVCALRAGVYEDRHTGLGLLNVHKRIRLYCGGAYGLAFNSVAGEGTTVTVRLPKNIQQES